MTKSKELMTTTEPTAAAKTMDHRRAPVFEALNRYRDEDQPAFGPPAHIQTRGADPEVVALLGETALRGEELLGEALELAAPTTAAIEESDGLHVNDRTDFWRGTWRTLATRC
ncbi:hypothetical protein HUT18_28770 [Streptomyces sp. NA04227]|uniref:hypothetical protein n=1 Tax=Streptomyces sp. NA04227 TaxID=2742136 RepID=UPI0015976337|nr:hypothetical protein [Streptomyces sp. NA04227]QKW09810.1 hypothetical protein HUT18_28770 [Streptomyces sp. NA04227]